MLDYFSQSDNLNEEILEEGSSMTDNPNEVLDKLLDTLRTNIGKQEKYVPTSPVSQPSPSLEMVNSLL